MSTSLAEKYRPRTYEQIVGQDAAIAVVNRIRRSSGNVAGRAWFLTGASGTGKDSIAQLLAKETAADWATETIDATTLTASDVGEIERRMRMRAIAGKGERSGRAVLISEVHGLKGSAIRALLVALERIPNHAVWIFTTTSDGAEALFEDQADASPLLSRCTTLALSRRGLADAFAARAKEIAEAEGLGGRTLAEYVKLAKACKNSMRMMLSRIETGEMLGDETTETTKKTKEEKSCSN